MAVSPPASNDDNVRTNGSRTALVARGAAAVLFVLGAVSCSGGEDEVVLEDQEQQAEEEVAMDFIEAETSTTSEAPDSVAFDDGDTDSNGTDTSSDEGDTDVDDTDDSDDDTTTEDTDGGIVVNPIGADSPAVPPGASGNYAIFRDGVIYLRGTAGSQEALDPAISTIELFVGRDNVINEMTIDPSYEGSVTETSKLYIADTVLFPSGSAVVSDEFRALLQPGALLLLADTDATITVTGYTDSDGDEASNLALSQARVDAVRAVLGELGADIDRVEAIGLGEADPVADNSTAEGRAQNRRVEFRINDFLN